MVRDRSQLPTLCCLQAVQVGEQPVPVTVAVGRGLHMAGLVGQDALGGGQGHWVFVDDGVVGAGLAVLGDIQQGIDAAGGPHHVIGGAPEPCQRMQLVVGQHGEGLRMGGGLPVQHIEHPAAKLFGQRSAGEHSDQMGAAQGEDSNLFLAAAIAEPLGHRIDDQGHAGGKFVGIAVVQVTDGLFAGIAKGLGDLGSGQPGLAVMGDNGELGVMEADAVHCGVSKRRWVTPPMTPIIW